MERNFIAPTTHMHFRLRKEFEDLTGLRIMDSKDTYIKFLESELIRLRGSQPGQVIDITVGGHDHG